MATMSQYIQFKTVRGTAVHIAKYTLFPESRAILVNFPFGGMVWQWPTAVFVQQGNQSLRRPIIDVTRMVTWSLLAASLLLPLYLRFILKNK